MTEAAAWRVLARGIALVFGLLLLLALLWALRAVLIQLLLAVLMAAALTPLVDGVARISNVIPGRWHPGRGLIAIAMFFITLVVLIGGIVALVAAVIPDLRRLADNLPRYVLQAQSALNAFLAERQLPVGPLASGGGQIQIQDLLAGAAGLATQAPRLVAIATGTFGELFHLVFALILALYITVDGDRIRRYVILFLPFDRQSQALDISERIGRRLGAWARGQALLSAIVGGMTWVAALALGLPYATALALIAAVGELLPGLGPVLAAIPLIAIGFLSSPTQGVIAIGIAIAIQQLENHLIVPRVMGQAVDLHPVVVMVAILAGSELLGVMGALVAVPVVASLAVVVDEVQRERIARHLGVSAEDTPLAGPGV